MAAGNRSPLGFGPILLFHLCIFATGVLLQNVYESQSSAAFAVVIGLGVGLGSAAGFFFRRFLWDVFRSFKSAGTLLTMLVLSCVLGTLIIQHLDLRRAGVYDEGLEPKGLLPPFDNRNMPTRVAIAQSHLLLWLWPNEERERMTEEKVKLSPVEEKQVALHRTAFSPRAARAYREAVLNSKKRHVNELTTSNFARKHFAGFYTFYRWVRRLHLFDIFEAWWFYALLGLIAVNVVVGTIVRAPWNVRDFGLVVTHAGILIILGGALLDLLVAKEGYIWFTYGRPEQMTESKIKDEKNRVYWHLPFRVHLDRFATEYYHELQVGRLDWSMRHDGSRWQEGQSVGSPFWAPSRFPIRAGVPRVFEDGKVRVTVREYKPRVFIKNRIRDSEDGPLNPALRIAIYDTPRGGRDILQARNFRQWLFARDRRGRALDLGEARFEYYHAGSEAEYQELLDEAPLPDNGTLVLHAGKDKVRVKVKLGSSRPVRLGERSVRVEFLEIRSALSQSENVNLDRKSQRSEEPRLFLRVDGRAFSVPRDDKEFTAGFGLLQGVRFQFDWPDPKDRGVHGIYRLVEAVGKPRVLVQADMSGAAVVTRLPRGGRVPLAGWARGFYVGVEERVRSFTQQRVVEEVGDAHFLARGGGAEDHLLAAWADIEVEGAWGKKRFQLTPFDASVEYGDDGNGRPVYSFSLVRTEMARDWFSVLSVIDHSGERLKSHAVQVNKPLRHMGYRFFQATASKTRDGLGVSGISVTYNPGVYFMYVGYTVLTAGVCYIFFLKPVITRRRRRRRRAEATGR